MAVNSLGNFLVDHELGHGVRDPAIWCKRKLKTGFRNVRLCGVRGGPGNLLFEQDGAETSVEGADTLRLQHLAETADQAAGVGGLGDETDTGSLKRAEGDVGEELGGGGGGQVDTSAVVGGVLVADQVDGLLLEELVTTELEGTLQEVTSSGGAETGQQSAGTLILDDLLEAANEAAVVGDGVELNTGLDAVHWAWLAALILQRKGLAVLILDSQRTDGRLATKGQSAIGAARELGGPGTGGDNEGSTYTSTGVRAPCVTEQQMAPARANLE